MEIGVLTAPTSWAELGSLLDEALELSSQERESWLSDLAATRPEAAGELRRLLELNSALDAEGFLESGPLLPPVPVRSLTGQRVGAYTLDSMLGQGGMGTVWLAHRSDGRFEGSVAIKLLNVALVGRPNESRFAREGSVLARLQHPNIARLADAGVAENGQPYWSWNTWKVASVSMLIANAGNWMSQTASGCFWTCSRRLHMRT